MKKGQRKPKEEEPAKKRWSVAIPIAGAVYVTMESETEPTFDEAVEYCAQFPRSVPPKGDLCWEWHGTLHGEGNVMRSFGHASVFDVSEIGKNEEEEEG